MQFLVSGPVLEEIKVKWCTALRVSFLLPHLFHIPGFSAVFSVPFLFPIPRLVKSAVSGLADELFELIPYISYPFLVRPIRGYPPRTRFNFPISSLDPSLPNLCCLPTWVFPRPASLILLTARPFLIICVLLRLKKEAAVVGSF